ncbi:unnamed protein product [Coffea canephora]|uniref:RING-type domain-containing protein n=2 Tax=Coffea TaxID=13442 RepID=A0A068UQB7_COFCA|nr:E3 ubiquitin-protein ligase RLIM-like [Coffea arabica]XP_027065632.1 E3 ubiquitin-protein ligase RLIM-like [Coffea arabica]XP_027072443.1 E3 ubiquitin-protein ligase RLIM-like [Coffea arabica]XP_027175481.1 E3 ubiquitin-protein ligase RLIM-like [Coffea eugenioides]CDP10512.1 unnamed protein product [Coffea canephora]
MAGMLPGVEVARRRRFHQSGGWLDSSSASPSGHCSTRRSSFCLYVSNHESPLSSSTSIVPRSSISQAYCDQKLNDAAREAKQRLDGRLRAQWKSETKRGHSGRQRSRQSENRPTEVRELQTEVSGVKKSGSKRFSWVKLSWKSSEQDECAVCLEEFRAEEKLMQLACAHRFHSGCLVPWLENNAHCPCCRTEIVL